MAKPFYRLQRFLRRTQLLFLFLGVAYIMAGSVLLLQRAALVVSQRGLSLTSSFLPLPSLPAPPRALGGTPVVRAGPVGARPPGSMGRYQASKSEDRAGPQWLLSRNQEIRQLRRRWFHSLMSEQDMTRADPITARRKAPHKGTVTMLSSTQQDFSRTNKKWSYMDFLTAFMQFILWCRLCSV